MKRYARLGIGLIVALPAFRTVLPGDLGQESGGYQCAKIQPVLIRQGYPMTTRSLKPPAGRDRSSRSPEPSRFAARTAVPKKSLPRAAPCERYTIPAPSGVQSASH